ncbi:DNA-binding protein [Devosia alba]|uniref:DNA-binding protein n=1 Tax=Devosia alba TaxID=3152360 RepID=UPI003263A779
MSAEIASLERVRQAVDTIRRRNGTPTADRIIELIGGGSKKTVLSHLRTLRDPQTEDDGVPAAIIEMARAALGDIYRAGGQAEADRARALAERLSTTLVELEVQIEELAEENGRSLQAIPEITRQRDEAWADRTRAEQRLAEALAANRSLESDLANEWLKRSQGIEKAIARIESIVSTASRSDKTPSPRATVSLPHRDRGG